MEKKMKGFTLVELLAVIAVLGLILIIAIPKVMETLNTQKKRTLELTTRSIIKAAEEKYLENNAYGLDEEITCEGISNITNTDFKSCDIIFDDNGNASVTIIGKGRYEGLTVCNGTKQTINVTLGEDSCVFRCQEGEKLVEIVNATKPYVIKSKNSCIAFATEIANEYNFSSEEKAIIEPACNNQTINGLTFTDMATNMISNGLITEKELIEKNIIEGKIEQTCEVSKGLECTFNKELKPGEEFIHNQYTYRYKEEYAIDMENLTGDFKSLNSDGWSVRVTDLESTSQINTPICSSINGKPVVSTAFMFAKFQDGNPVSSKATSIDVSSWDTSNVTNMMGMFVGVSGDEIKGISSLETDKVTNMALMFALNQLDTIDLSGLNFENVEIIDAMFLGSTSDVINLSNANFSKVKNASILFANLDMQLYSNVKTVNMSNVNFSGLESGTTMFSGIIGETFDLNNANFSGLTSLESIFVFINVKDLNLSNVDLRNVTDVGGMFSLCGMGASSDKVMNINLTNTNLNSVVDATSMFSMANVNTIDMTGIKMPNLTNVYQMFYDTSIEKVIAPDLNLSNVTSLGSMIGLGGVKYFDVSNWNVSNVTSMGFTFFGSSLLTIDLSKWDTSNVTNMAGMFYNSAATTIDVSNFNTSKVTNMSNMFNGTRTEILDLSSFDTSNVTDMTDMFAKATATIGYARTQADADRFNASSNKPATLTFVVK